MKATDLRHGLSLWTWYLSLIYVHGDMVSSWVCVNRDTVSSWVCVNGDMVSSWICVNGDSVSSWICVHRDMAPWGDYLYHKPMRTWDSHLRRDLDFQI